MNTQFAYHCTNVDPKLIAKHGFDAQRGKGLGYTDINVLTHFYNKFLPKNPLFVSALDAKVWDANAKWCMKIDISGLPKFPDFGHLLDFGAYYDEDFFWWQDEYEVRSWLSSNDVYKRRLAHFILEDLDDMTLYAADFDGDTSFEVLGTCCVNGSLVGADRIVEVKQRAI